MLILHIEIKDKTQMLVCVFFFSVWKVVVTMQLTLVLNKYSIHLALH